MVSKRALRQVGVDATNFFGAFVPLKKSDLSPQEFFDFSIGNIHGLDELSLLLKENHKSLTADSILYSRHYPGTQGLSELNSKLAELIKKEKKISVNPEQIVLTNGAVDSISNVAFLYSEQGESSFYGAPSFPYWSSFEREQVRSEICFFSTPKEYKEQFGEKFQEEVEQKKEIKTIIFNVPHNPLGVSISPKQAKIINNACIENGLKVIIDDVYSSFMEPSFQLSGFEEESRVIIDSFSKKFALPGLRLGYTVIPENDKKYFRAIMANKSIGVSNLVASIASNLVDFYQKHNLLKKISDEIKKRNFVLEKFLAKLKSHGINAAETDGGLYRVFLLDEFSNRNGINSEKLCEIFSAKGVKVLPGSKFYPANTSISLQANFFRLSLGGDKRIKEGMERMLEIIEKIS